VTWKTSAPITFIIFVPQIIKAGRNLTKFRQNRLC